MKDETPRNNSGEAIAPVDHTLTHLVTRISSAGPEIFSIFFNAIGRSLAWHRGDAAPDEAAGVVPGTPQGVCAAVAEAIATDEGLAPHFRIEPIAPDVADGPAEAPAAEEGAQPKRRRERPTAVRPGEGSQPAE